MDKEQLIYEWNQAGTVPAGNMSVELNDETLRDGLQSPSVAEPSIGQKLELVHLMCDLGIHAADIGLPGAGPAVFDHVVRIAREIAEQRLPLSPNCAARTLEVDITPIIEASQRSGAEIEVALFIGSSPIRGYVEDWSVEKMIDIAVHAITLAVDNGLPVMFVTEDTTRSHPDTLDRLYSAAIEAGARRICVADTVGYATPHGTRMLVKLVRDVVNRSGHDVSIDWHGHADRGLSLVNALAAIEAGVDRVHGTGLGVGERCGNTAMELLLINLKLLGYIDNDLTHLPAYCELVSKALQVPIRFNHPAVGSDAFRTCTGVHAAAVIKALKKSDQSLADQIYSAVPASWVGRRQEIEIGPMSGASNVIYWLRENKYEPSDELVKRILGVAKRSGRRLTREQIENLIHPNEESRHHAES